MDRLKAIEVFVTVAQLGGFAAAASALGLSSSSVSRHVGNLEDELGVQLLHRTTRNLSLTAAGEDVLEHGRKIVGHVERMLSEQRLGRSTPSGRLRITMPNFLGAILMRGAIAEFAKRHPEVETEFLIVDRVVNLIDEGFDVAIRVGRMADSSLVARKLLDLHLGVIAAPTYLERCGAPARPADLADHNCILDNAAPYRQRWPFTSPDGETVVQAVGGNIAVNSGAAARDLALGGVGLAYLPEYLFFDDIEAGRLVTVLDDYAIDFGGIFLVYPPSRHQGAAIRRFAEVLVDHAKRVKRYREARRLAAAFREEPPASGA